LGAFERILIVGILLGAIYGLVSMGLSLIFGVVRTVNFAHGELVMLGMYGAYEAQRLFGWNSYLTLVVVVPALFVIGLIIQRCVIQPLTDQPTMQIFATFGLAIFFQNVVLAMTKGDTETVSSPFADKTFSVGSVHVDAGRTTVFVAAALVALGLYLLLQRTGVGRSIRAVAQDRQSARLMGINVERTLLVTFAIGSALAGFAGVLLAPVYSLTPTVGQNFIYAAFTVVVLGGLGSISGAYLAGFIVGLVEALSSYYVDPTLSTAFYFVLFLVVLVVRPTGMFGRAGSEEMGLR